jgi:hypothetical protein
MQMRSKVLSKSIDTLVEEIYGLFGGHDCDPERVEALGKNIAGCIRDRLASYAQDREFTLRVSNLGKPDRQLWYEANDPAKEELSAHTKVKFLYGDILEHLLLFLAAEAGHEVSHEQTEIEIDGIKGHNDAVIDGVVIDCKSASTHSFKKFRDGTLAQDDPFGYMEQLAGYSRGLGGLPGGFLAIDKQNGHIALMQVPVEELDALQIEDRIKYLKDVVTQPKPPERCYDPVPEGKSGNEKLAVGCSYCPHKFKCWADANDGIGLRSFLYSTGPVHLVKVEAEPRVVEVTF